MNNIPLLICFGTRPEWLKIKPLVKILPRESFKLLFTGQHTDLVENFSVDYHLTISGGINRLDAIISDCLLQFPNEEFSGVLVQGDTASAFGCALAAYNRKLPIYYLEAGLRSYDLENPYPEEAYRQMISRISTVNFSPTTLSANNLRNEQVSGKIYVVGNTVLDNLMSYSKGTYGKNILVTLHRKENHSIMKEWFTVLEELANKYTEYNFLLPMHPNTNVDTYKSILKKVNVIPPMTHTETINLLKDCLTIITDSGGLQEEGAFFNKKVIVCRKTTERPEGIQSGHLYMCEHPSILHEVFDRIVNDPYVDFPCPYGDGNSSSKIKDILNDEIF